MSNTWFKQWLAVRKQVAFLIPILLLAMAFAVVLAIGTRTDHNDDSMVDAVLVIKTPTALHILEIDSKAGRIVNRSEWDVAAAGDSGDAAATFAKAEGIPEGAVQIGQDRNSAIWVNGDALMSGSGAGAKMILRDKILTEVKAAGVAFWARKPVAKRPSK